MFQQGKAGLGRRSPSGTALVLAAVLVRCGHVSLLSHSLVVLSIKGEEKTSGPTPKVVTMKRTCKWLQWNVHQLFGFPFSFPLHPTGMEIGSLG